MSASFNSVNRLTKAQARRLKIKIANIFKDSSTITIAGYSEPGVLIRQKQVELRMKELTDYIKKLSGNFTV